MEVTLEQLRVSRDGRLVLDIPALQLRGQRTTAILGPNGSGKTTLLRVLAGLQAPAAGRVGFGGDSRPQVAYVFQEEVFLRQSVRANLELGLRLRGLDAAARRERVDAASELLGITHLLARQADHLSGGEGRRVSLARALCLRAPLVLLDEPLAGLDERTYSRLLDELPRLLAAFDATTLLVTHNRNEAIRLAQDLVVLVDGRALASGEKREVAFNPRVPEVAEVLGYVVLESGGCRLAVPRDGFRLGPGAHQFAMAVEEVVDLVERREAVGRVGGARVHVAVPDDQPVPPRGSEIVVSAARICELPR